MQTYLKRFLIGFVVFILLFNFFRVFSAIRGIEGGSILYIIVIAPLVLIFFVITITILIVRLVVLKKKEKKPPIDYHKHPGPIMK